MPTFILKILPRWILVKMGYIHHYYNNTHKEKTHVFIKKCNTYNEKVNHQKKVVDCFKTYDNIIKRNLITNKHGNINYIHFKRWIINRNKIEWALIVNTHKVSYKGIPKKTINL